MRTRHEGLVTEMYRNIKLGSQPLNAGRNLQAQRAPPELPAVNKNWLCHCFQKSRPVAQPADLPRGDLQHHGIDQRELGENGTVAECSNVPYQHESHPDQKAAGNHNGARAMLAKQHQPGSESLDRTRREEEEEKRS